LVSIPVRQVFINVVWVAAEIPESKSRRMRTVMSVPRCAYAEVQLYTHSDTELLISWVGPTAPAGKSYISVMTQFPARCSSWTETCQPFAFAFDAIASRLVQASELRSSSFRHPVPRSQTHALEACSLHHKASMKRPQDTLIGSSNNSHPVDQLPAWEKSSALFRSV
jgi:hypothetical protein